MDTKQQKQLETEQEVAEGKKGQLLEIYKLHSQLASNISNRRTTIHRFYQIILSGLLLIFFTFLQREDLISVEVPAEVPAEESKDESTSKRSIGPSMLLGYIGMLLSWMWFISINSYLQEGTRKYEVLKKLEAKLEYQFFTQEWELLGEKRKHLPYNRLFWSEICVPVVFFAFFVALFVVRIAEAHEKHIFSLPVCLAFFMHPVLLTVILSAYCPRFFRPLPKGRL